MGLNLEKLEKARKLTGGIVQARCPACAEGGNDRTGEHLRVYPDGRFGCCVHPKDRDHRKRIFALAGDRQRQDIRVKVAAPQVAKILQPAVLGRLGRVFTTPTGPTAPNTTTVGTFGTTTYPSAYAKNKIDTLYVVEISSSVPSVPELSLPLDFETPVPSVPTADVPADPQTGVPSVPTAAAAEPVLTDGQHCRLPHLTAGGDLSIPFDSPERYHWWRGGQSVAATMKEVRAALAIKKG